MAAAHGLTARAHTAALPRPGKAPHLLKPALIVAVIVALGLFVPSVLKSTFYLGLLVNAIILGIAAVAIGW